MATFATVRASDLGDRLDAGFHIARSEVRGRTEELAATVSPEEAIRRLEAIPNIDKQPLKALARGQAGTLNAAAIDRIVKEYPHLSLAIMERNAGQAADRIRAEIARSQSGLEAVLAIAPDLPSEEEEPSAPRP